MALDLIAELEALVDALDREGVDYAICGGLALALHGHPRATIDIDVLVRSEDAERAVQVARGVGFDLPTKRMTLGRNTATPLDVQRVSKLDAGTNQLLSLDLILVAPGDDDVWNGRLEVQAGDRRMVVVSRDGLATMKKRAGRPQDLADLAALDGTNDDDPEA